MTVAQAGAKGGRASRGGGRKPSVAATPRKRKSPPSNPLGSGRQTIYGPEGYMIPENIPPIRKKRATPRSAPKSALRPKKVSGPKGLSAEEKARRIAAIHAKARVDIGKIQDEFYRQRDLVRYQDAAAQVHDAYAANQAIARLREERDILIGMVKEKEADDIMKVKGL